MSNGEYQVVDVFWREAGITIQVVRLPDEGLEEKLALISKEEGISKQEYHHFLISKCLLDVDMVGRFIDTLSKTDAEEDILVFSVVKCILEVNPVLDPDTLVLSAHNIIRLPSRQDNTKDPKCLSSSPRWEEKVSDLVDDVMGSVLEDLMDPDDYFEDENIEDAPYSVKTVEWEAASIPVKLKEFSEHDAKKVFSNRTSFLSERQYKSFVLAKGIVEYWKLVALIQKEGIQFDMSPDDITEIFYEMCVDVNPFMGIDHAKNSGYIKIVDTSPKTRAKKPSGNRPTGKTKTTASKEGTEKKKRRPKKTFSDVSKKDLLSLGNRMSKRLIGQEEVIDAIAEAVQVAGAGLRDPIKPIGVFLLTGDTGTGKTLCSKVLAKNLMGSENNIVRIDCSEYAYGHEISKLIGCFAPGAKVSMRGGMPKNIEEINVGEKVLSHTGEVRKVKETFAYDYAGKMLSVKIANDSRPIVCTPKHEFWAICSEHCWHTHGKKTVCKPTCNRTREDTDNCSNHLFEKYEPSWVMAKDLRPGDIVIQPKYLASGSYPDVLDLSLLYPKAHFDSGKIWLQKNNKINRFINIDEDFARFAGYYIAEGGVSRNDKTIDLSFHLDETEYQEEVVSLAKKIFGLNTYFSRPPAEEKTGKKRKRCYICSRIAGNLIRSLFGAWGSDNKKLPSWWANLPEVLLSNFTETAIFGDGCTTIKRRIDYSTISVCLATQMRLILSKLGYITHLHKDKPKKLAWKPRYRIYISGKQINYVNKKMPGLKISGLDKPSNIQRKAYQDNKNIYKQIDSIKEVDYSGKVYDLHVDKDVSYQVNDIAVHNSPAGYIAHDDGGILTNKVKADPFSVVLFDELEKAHSKLYDILLQILDEGKLTDNKGTVVGFSDTIILMTSNIGVKQVKSVGKTVGFGDGAVLTHAKKSAAISSALKKHFKPEFLNRIDSIITFNSLGKDASYKIIDLELNLVAKYLIDRGTSIEISKAVKDRLFSVGFSPIYGARELKRAIERLIAKPLALKILRGNIPDKAHVLVNLNEDEIVFTYRNNATLDVPKTDDFDGFGFTD